MHTTAAVAYAQDCGLRHSQGPCLISCKICWLHPRRRSCIQQCVLVLCGFEQKCNCLVSGCALLTEFQIESHVGLQLCILLRITKSSCWLGHVSTIADRQYVDVGCIIRCGQIAVHGSFVSLTCLC